MAESDSLMIRLQFPNGLTSVVPVRPATTVEELYERHVAPEVPEGLRGQLIYMGRPLAPPTSSMASHGINSETVVQIFMRRPVPVSANGDPEEPQLDVNGLPVNPHTLSALFGFAIVSSWLYFFLGADDESETEWGDLHVMASFCLLFFTVIFVVSGGLRQLANLF
jgi:hypothetical protein